MIVFEGLDENFRFLVLEVESQIRSTYRFLATPTRDLYHKITSRDDYIDNLKTIIENKCYSRINTEKGLDKRSIDKIRALQVMCVNLERIADFCVNISRQVEYFSDPAFLQNYDYGEAFDLVLDAMKRVIPAFRRELMSEALAICKSEYHMDRIYKERFDRFMAELGTGRNTQNLITALFIFRYLERVGDSLLNIGEALIFSILGERIKIEQFDALQQTLSKSGFAETIQDIDFTSIWGTRSGCRIGKVDPKERRKGVPDGRGTIYKEGDLDKIRREKENLSRWATIDPRLVAQVYGFHEEGEKGSLLVEFLPGCTLDEVILTSTTDYLLDVLFILKQTMTDIWETTRMQEVMSTGYVQQIMSRLESVLQVHPGFTRPEMFFHGTRITPSDELLARCAEREKEIPAPFSVFIHGDFNINNIVYNNDNQQIHYIDLYRSRQYDYIQDASVFLVSNFRMPIFDRGPRDRLNDVIEDVLHFIYDFAEEHGDATCRARLALALARSFYTSTRFELNHVFAKEMFLRALYLLERIAFFSGRWSDFHLPGEVLYL